MQRVIWGQSEYVEAEYSARAREAFTLAEAEDDTIYVVRGFDTRFAMVSALKEYADWPREKVGR